MAEMTMLEKVAQAIHEADPECGFQADDPSTHWRSDRYPPEVWDITASIARAAVEPLMKPTETQYFELARDIVMWLDMADGRSGAMLHLHLTRLGRQIPDWLAEEIPNSSHAPSKGTVAACIYKAMLKVILDEKQ